MCAYRPDEFFVASSRVTLAPQDILSREGTGLTGASLSAQTLEQIRVIRSLAHRNGSYKDRGKTNVQCCFHLQWLDSHYTGLVWTFVEIV